MAPTDAAMKTLGERTDALEKDGSGENCAAVMEAMYELSGKCPDQEILSWLRSI